MKHSREIKTFIFSVYFSDGIRITMGVLLPSLVMAQYGRLETGIIASLGALFVSIADNPGPLTHKRNGILFCLFFITISALFTGFVNHSPILLALEIPVFCFFFSMFNVYGNRASSIGTAALLVMILMIDRQLSTSENIANSLLLLAGGFWYFILSMTVSQIRPYRIAQQSLGGCIREVSKYLSVKADFYGLEKDYDKNYKDLISQQIVVNEQQDAVRELLFKSRLFIKESTETGRQLILIFVDIIDLFEQTMATHYDYKKIRRNFSDVAILPHFKNFILNVSEELENLSYYIISNEQPLPLHDFIPQLGKLKAEIDKVEQTHGINVLVLKKILINLRNIVNRIQKIYSYYNQKHLLSEPVRTEADVEQFISHQDYDIKVFRENLSFDSTIFRHALRVAIVCLSGYLISKSLELGHHSYWILLTILVILKPGFSLSKERNYQRLIGTVIGGIAGACIVLYIKDETVRFALMLFFMIGTYSFQRLNYVVSVLFLTPFILIMFSFIGFGTLNIAQERMFDTVLGSVIAFVASNFIFPAWEYRQLKGHMRSSLIANYYYLKKAAEKLSGLDLNITEYKLARKEVYVSTANLSAAFQRMLSEPKSKQKNVKEVSNFVVLNHIFTSYIASLFANLRQSENGQIDPSHVKLIKRALYQLIDSIQLVSTNEDDVFKDESTIQENLTSFEDSHESKLITEQLEFIANVSGDLQKIAQSLKGENSQNS